MPAGTLMVLTWPWLLSEAPTAARSVHSPVLAALHVVELAVASGASCVVFTVKVREAAVTWGMSGVALTAGAGRPILPWARLGTAWARVAWGIVRCGTAALALAAGAEAPAVDPKATPESSPTVPSTVTAQTASRVRATPRDVQGPLAYDAWHLSS